MSENPEYFQKRADAAGEKIRNYLLGMNSAAIGASLTLAGVVDSAFLAFIPCLFFVTSLWVTGDCLFMSKDKALRQRYLLQDQDRNELSDRQLSCIMRFFYTVLCFITRVDPREFDESVVAGSTSQPWYRHTTYDLIAIRLFVWGLVFAVAIVFVELAC